MSGKKRILIYIVVIIFAASLASCADRAYSRKVKNCIDTSGMIWSTTASGVRSAKFRLNGGGEGSTYAVSTEDGSLLVVLMSRDGYPEFIYTDSHEYADDDLVSWYYAYPPERDGVKGEPFYGEKTYIDVTVMKDSHITGYAVIEVSCEYVPESGDYMQYYLYTGSLLGQYEFPMQDGEYQDITEEYVAECIAKLKK